MGATGILVVLAAELLHGCAGNPTSVGELRFATFEYGCVNETDILCHDDRFASEFPQVVGRAARFKLDVEPLGGGDAGCTVPWEVESVDETRVARVKEGFLAKKVGVVAMLARCHKPEMALDFVHMRVDVLGDVGSGFWPSSLMPGESEEVEVEADIAGTFDFRWSSSDERILTVKARPNTVYASVNAVGVGTAFLELAWAEEKLRHEIEVVSPDASTEPDASEEDDAGP